MTGQCFLRRSALPSTSVDFNCVVINGQPYFNVEDPDEPMQMTFRDTMEEEESEVRSQQMTTLLTN
jgi:hypothetical protein